MTETGQVIEHEEEIPMTEVTPIQTPQPSHAQLPAPITPMQLIAIATEKGADVSQIEKLMDLQLRWEANEARKQFIAAKAGFKAEAPKLSKNKHVHFKGRDSNKPDTDYWHTTLDQIAEKVSPVLGKHDLSYAWQTQQMDGGVIRVTCVLTHVMGHSESVTLGGSPDQSGGKNAIQAVGSTVTYLQRYTLLAVLGMATSDQDDDGDGGAGPDDVEEGEAVELISNVQKDELIELLKGKGQNTKGFLSYMQVETLDDIPAARFAEAKGALLEKAKQLAEEETNRKKLREGK